MNSTSTACDRHGAVTGNTSDASRLQSAFSSFPTSTFLLPSQSFANKKVMPIALLSHILDPMSVRLDASWNVTHLLTLTEYDLEYLPGGDLIEVMLDLDEAHRTDFVGKIRTSGGFRFPLSACHQCVTSSGPFQPSKNAASRLAPIFTSGN